MRYIDQLYQLITPEKDAVRLRTAKVESFTSTRVSLTLVDTYIANVPYLASYSPAVGDTVLALQTTAGLLIVIGETK